MSDVRGAIVRVVPGAGLSPGERAELLDLVRRAGAAHAWLAPRVAAAEVVAREELPAERAEPPRALVLRMVEEAHTRDRARLLAVVDEAITAEGL
jgi:hypothetical protein